MTNFKKSLINCGLSYRGASKIIGVSYETIKSWSTGRRNAPQKTLDNLELLKKFIEKTFNQIDGKND